MEPSSAGAVSALGVSGRNVRKPQTLAEELRGIGTTEKEAQLEEAELEEEELEEDELEEDELEEERIRPTIVALETGLPDTTVEVRGELRDRVIPLLFILVESCSGSYGKTLRYVLASAATFLDAVLIDSGTLGEFQECNLTLNTLSGKIWYSFGEEDDAQPLLPSLPISVISAISMSAAGSNVNLTTGFPVTLITIHVHFSSAVGLLEERPRTLYFNAVKNSLFALCRSCDAFYTLSMPEQEALWSEATASPRLLAAVKEVNRVHRVPTRVILCSSALAHQKYASPDATLRTLLEDVGLSESELVVVGGSVVLVDREVTLLRLWETFQSNDLFLYIVVLFP